MTAFPNQLILFQNAHYETVKDTITQVLDLYCENLPYKFSYFIGENDSDEIFFWMDSEIDNEIFFFMINSMLYPDDKSTNLKLKAWSYGQNIQSLKDKRILVEPFSGENDYNSVDITTEDNQNFYYDYGGNLIISTKNNLYHSPKFPAKMRKNSFTFENIKRIELDIENRNKSARQTPWRQYRLFVLFLIISVYLYLHWQANVSINSCSTAYDPVYLVFFFCCWILLDEKLLKFKKFYTQLMAITFGILCYGIYLHSIYVSISETFLDIPLIVLIIQRPLWRFIARVMKKEPNFLESRESFTSSIYVLLWIGLTIGIKYILDRLLLL